MMIRILAFLVFSLAAELVSAQKVSLNLARETYFGMSADECNGLKLSNDFGENPPKDALLLAYYGAATAAAPACLGNPAKKISYFRRGKQAITEATLLQPQNFEIRFLRFATQSKTPSFLGYNQDIENDKRFLLANLKKGRETVSNDRIFNKMTDFIAKSGQLTKNELEILKRENHISEN